MDLMQRQRMIWKSYRSLPLWVQVWVGLIPEVVRCITRFSSLW